MFDDIFDSDDKEFKALFDKIEKIVLDIPAYFKNNFDNEEELINLGVKESIRITENNKDDKISKNLFESLNLLTLSNTRISRYAVYDEIVSSIPLLKRILKVYHDNIIQKDILTNQSLKLVDKLSSDTRIEKDECKNVGNHILSFYDLDNRMSRNLIYSYLKYGDGFIELINLDDYDIEEVPTSDKKNSPSVIKLKHKYDDMLVSELEEINTSLTKMILDHSLTDTNLKSFNENIVDRCFGLLFEIQSQNEMIQEYVNEHDLEEDLIEITEAKLKIKREKESDAVAQDENKSNRDQLKRISIRFHKPHKIVKLINEHEYLLGYIEILEEPSTKNELDQVQTDATTNPTKSLVSILNSLSSVQKTPKNENNLNTIIDKFINTIVNNLLSKNPKLNKKIKDPNKLKSKINDDLIYSIKNLIMSISDNRANKLKIRYIDSSHMFNAMIDPSDYYPYGQSTIDSLIEPAKLYSISKLASIINKLSRSSQLRKWTLETGIREDKKGLVEKFKNNLRNQTITAADLTSKNVANILSDFKDVITFTKKGTQFVNMELMNTGDPNYKADDLEALKNDLLALSGIPSTYLGYGDVFELKEQLINVNVQFSSEIASLQKNINAVFTKLFDQIFKIIGKKYVFSEFFQVSLTPPVLLLLQLIETSLNSVQNTISSLKELDQTIKLDPVNLLKLLCPYVEWDSLIAQGTRNTLKNELTNTAAKQDEQ